MPIKRSADVGKALGRLLESEQANHDQLAFDFNVSPQMISHMKQGRRKMQEDIAKESIALYDNPEYILDILYEFSSGFTSPVLRGKQIEQNRLALAVHAKREMALAITLMESSGLELPPSTADREAIQELASQLITVRVVSDNFLKQLQVEYKVSVREQLKRLARKWLAVGWM